MSVSNSFERRIELFESFGIKGVIVVEFSLEVMSKSKEDFLNSNLLGYGKKHPKIDDFIGDYIAIAISDVSINLGTYLSPKKNVKLSDHCGLTKNEMEVPLILFDLK